MDFARLMSSAIGKPTPKSPPSTTDTKPKYQRRADLEAQREAAYRAEQQALSQSAAEKASAKRKLATDEAERASAREEKKRKLAEASRQRREEEARATEVARRKRLGLPPLPDPTLAPAPEALKEEEEDIEDADLRTKLRDLNEPIALFAEGHVARLRRYRELVRPKPKLSNGPIPTTLELLPEAEMKIPDTVPSSEEPERELLFRQLASYFTLVLTEWRRTLDHRDSEIKDSVTGMQAEAALEQSRDNLRPLFKVFESLAMEKEMLEAVVGIVRAAQARRYVDANNKYLELSIGKAAWPIGVVSVGIHERASRSRIGEERKNVAHIMGDETARRWLQAIKRCISFAQTRWPPDDQMQLMG